LQRVLAHTKNGDRLFWEEKFHAANGKAQACTQGALIFFPFKFFPFFSCSQCVPFKFPTGSHYAPQFSNVFHNMFSITPHFYPICLGKCCPPFRYIGGPKGKNSLHVKVEHSILGSLHSFIFLNDEPIKLASCKKQNLNLGAPHLINRRGIIWNTIC
jgi:hypothetical protein